MADKNFLGLDWENIPTPKKNVKKADPGEPGSEKFKRVSAALRQETQEAKEWAKRHDEARKATNARINFLGIDDMLKADEQKRQERLGRGGGGGGGGGGGRGGGGGGGGGSLLRQMNPQALIYKKGGKVRTASQRADGIAMRGKTRA